ncbi:MAG: RDD family protein [Blastocatellia bacterium]|nr:RDD family protein [Blastocatellia bacterium]
MKCIKCAKEQSEKASVCPYCGFRFPKELKEAKEIKETSLERSTLIEFPLAANKPADKTKQQAANPNNNWRAELSAKVREVKERRNMQEARGRLQAELEAAAQRYQQTNPPINNTGLAINSISTSIDSINANIDSEDRTSNPVVEAALKRVQRASEIAVKRQQYIGAAAAIAASKTVNSPSTLPQPQQIAKAKSTALPEAHNLSSLAVSPTPNIEVDNSPIIKPDVEIITTIPSVKAKITSAVVKTVATSAKTVSTPTVGATAVAPVIIEEIVETPVLLPITDEIEIPQVNAQEAESVLESLLEQPIEQPKQPSVRVIRESESGPNYLDELIAVCEQNRTLSSERPNKSQRLIAATIDLFIILLVSAMFWATSYTLGVDFSDQRIIYILSGTSFFTGLIYLTMMVFVAARTFGMMFVGTRVVNSNTFESPSFIQSLLRAASYFVSVALVGLGFVWMFLDPEQRTLHDIVSSTLVVRDY